MQLCLGAQAADRTIEKSAMPRDCGSTPQSRGAARQFATGRGPGASWRTPKHLAQEMQIRMVTKAAEVRMPNRELRACPDDTDERLMTRYASGDAEAFEELFRRYEPRAYGFFLKRTGSPQRAEDLYQELFLRIHRARNQFDSSRAFTPWFFQIANRLLIDDRRRAFRGKEVAVDGFDASATEATAESLAADREEVGLLLDTLSPEERYVVVAAKMGGIAYPELADHLGKSVDAVKKMASRALQRVRAEAALSDALESPAG